MKNFGPSQWSLKERLIATVAYFDVFNVPVLIKDLEKLLIGRYENSTQEVIKECDKSIDVIDGYICLRGRGEIVKSAVKKSKRVNTLIQRARKKVWILRLVPFVKFVAICNFLPLGVAEEHSDIDLFVVAKKNRLFTVRVFMTFFTQLFGMRRHSKKIKGRFCLSFYSDENYLDFEELLLQPYDIYFAYWVLALMPLYGEQDVFNDIKNVNDVWLRRYFESTENRYFKFIGDNKKQVFANVLEWVLLRKLGDFLEKKLADYFIARYEKNKAKLPESASVEVNRKRLKFHNNDMRTHFNREFERRLNRLGLSH